ncbi:MAG: hypothetical protein S4CHLAM7_05060 [Chlamydiae bacterium]|nr:hypothetical protein [Chlamydiota bacterium]
MKNELDRETYISWMKKSDVILLPYSDPHYEKSTSSIFLEAILARKIPLVYPNTWMAYELKKYNLEELIIDWKPNELADLILKAYSNNSLLDKLDKMRGAYEKFHHLDNYAETMKLLV